MTRIAIVGSGRSATLHGEAALAVPGVTLIGIAATNPQSAAPLAAALAVPILELSQQLADAEGIVVAVPPRQAARVLSAIPGDFPVLLESPVGLRDRAIDRPSAMTAVNLLHADAVKRGLRAIADLRDVHHIALRSQAHRPTWGVHGTAEFGGGALLDPAAGALPVALAAAGVAVTEVAASTGGGEADGIESSAQLRLTLHDGRSISAELSWDDSSPAETELEVAGANGVVLIRLWPRPALEIDGAPVPLADAPPLVALGFVEQMRRFGAVAAGSAVAWPPLSVGDGVLAITEAAARSAGHGGEPIRCEPFATSYPADRWNAR